LNNKGHVDVTHQIAGTEKTGRLNTACFFEASRIRRSRLFSYALFRAFSAKYLVWALPLFYLISTQNFIKKI